ncbi:hypothetical protein D3C85_1432000 [compost metagenome]
MRDSELIHHPGVQHNLILSGRQPAFYKVNKTVPGGRFVDPLHFYRTVLEHLIPQIACIQHHAVFPYGGMFLQHLHLCRGKIFEPSVKIGA